MGTPKSSIPASRTGAPARALVFQTMEESLRSKVCYGLMGKICLSAGGTGGEGFKWTHLWLQRMPCELNISVSSVLLVVLCTSLRSVSNKTQIVQFQSRCSCPCSLDVPITPSVPKRFCDSSSCPTGAAWVGREKGNDL